jgi:hypothetical protein
MICDIAAQARAFAASRDETVSQRVIEDQRGRGSSRLDDRGTAYGQTTRTTRIAISSGRLTRGQRVGFNRLRSIESALAVDLPRDAVAYLN